jgi:hypothetical protein
MGKHLGMCFVAYILIIVTSTNEIKTIFGIEKCLWLSRVGMYEWPWLSKGKIHIGLNPL